MQVTESELLDLFSRELRVERDALTRDATPQTLRIDSIDVMSILFEVEERFGIVIDGNDLPPHVTVGALTDYLLSRINSQAPGA